MATLNSKLPEIDLYGNKIPEDSIFFQIPENIGNILMASTSLVEGQGPSTNWIIRHLTSFKGACWYIGDNGFAVYSFSKTVENVRGVEINFDNVTDLHKGTTKQYINSMYQCTDYEFLYMNNSTPVYHVEDKYNNEKEEEGKYSFLYHFLSLVEKQWTNKLIATMYNDITKKGYISFNYATGKYLIKVNLGISFIEYASCDNQHTLRYEKDDICSLSFQNGGLIMTLKNKKEVLVFLRGQVCFCYAGSPDGRR